MAAGAAKRRNGGSSFLQSKKCACGYGKDAGCSEHLAMNTNMGQKAYQVAHRSANPKWNLRK